MDINLSYFIVNKHDIVSLTDEKTYEVFKEWIVMHCDYARMPWGDLLCLLDSYVVEKEEYDLQEQVFSDCSLKIQNLIYKLKEKQLLQNPENSAELAFSNN